jgi:hypothetical protein
MQWPRLLAYISGRVDKEWLVRNEYLAAALGFCEPRSKAGCNYRTGRSVAWPKSPTCDPQEYYIRQKSGGACNIVTPTFARVRELFQVADFKAV